MSLKTIFPSATLNDPAQPNEIDKVERALGIKFPSALRELYLECDGFREPTGNAKYLLSLTNDDFIGSLVETTRSLWANREYWKPVGIDPTDFIFFGYSSADEVWGIRIEAPHDVIEYHHGQGDELTRLNEDVFKIFRDDFQKYDD
jgi:hypothetical protein